MITIKVIKEVADRIILETRQTLLSNRIADTEIAILSSGFGKLISKLYEIEEKNDSTIYNTPS